MGKAAAAPTVPGAVDEDEDLPPREGSSPEKIPSSSGAEAISTERPPTPSNDPIANIPKHAGFDLSAMKNVIDEVEQDPNKHQIQLPAAKSILNRFGAPPLASPAARPQSTPPVHTPEADPHPRSSSVDNYATEAKFAASSSSSSYTTTYDDIRSFSRSASDSYTESSSYYTSSSSSHSMQQKTSNAGSSYYPSRPSTNLTHTLGLPDETMPSWGATSSSTSFGTPSSSSMSTNPFANASTTSFGHNPTLSFGPSDGSIVGSSGSQGDAWSIPPLGKMTKKNGSTIDGFNANPWS